MERLELARLLGAAPRLAEARDVTVEERDPERFMAAFTEGVAAGGTVFLADPAWGREERAQLAAIVARPAPPADRGWLAIPTGGSSGRLKLARHDQDTIAAAVRGFCGHFSVTRVNAVGLLPLHHVSGFMAWMRCALTGGTYLPWDGGALLAGRRPPRPTDGDWFLSLVPTQLARLLDDAEAVAWLRGFRAVFVGGGPAWPELIEAGARQRLPLAFSYGMTETAAMVAALRPEAFLAGGRGCGPALPHARIEVAPDGTLAIAAASLFLGYYPDFRPDGPWMPDDLGRFDEHGSLHVLGRRDGLILTGGEKVDPGEVETALRATGAFADVAVLGVSDPDWGEAVVAAYPAGGAAPDLAAVEAYLRTALAPFKRPKRYVAVSPWPRNAQGKLNRAELRAAAERQTAGFRPREKRADSR